MKFAVSGGAIYVVFNNIDWNKTKEAFIQVKFDWLILAAIVFTLSKIAGSVRLNLYFKDIGLRLTELKNLRLYWICLFYNLFLPGGIGGDGYRLYLLNKQLEIKVKLLIQATLWDRISGLIALLILAGIGYLFLDTALLPDWIFYFDIVGLIICIPIYYWVIIRFFPAFRKSFFSTTCYSFVVQILQVICAYHLLLSLGVDSKFMEYEVLFLVSSVISVLPFTIGGIGARELTFIMGYQLLGIDQNVSVAFSLLFFTITAIVSLSGVFFKERLHH